MVAGVPVSALNLLLAVARPRVTIALSMRIVGVLLIAALMVLPVTGRVADRVEPALDRCGSRWPIGLGVRLRIGL